MARNDHEDDQYDDDDTQDTNLVRDLRKQLKEQTRSLTEFQEKFEKLSTESRGRSITEILTSKGVNPKVAKLLPADLDPTPEKVSEWLDEYADVFGIVQPSQEDEQGGSAIIADDAELGIESGYAGLHTRISQSTQAGQPVGKADSDLNRVLTASSAEELTKIINGG